MFGRNQDNNTGEQSSEAIQGGQAVANAEQPKELDPAVKEKIIERSKQLETMLGKIVGLLMRSQNYRNYKLADLEWLILPALASNQISLAQAQKQESGQPIPIGLATWAKVSEEVDKKLSENLENPIRLQPNEWRSGEIYWLIDAVGTPAVVQGLIKGLRQSALKDKTFKMRVITKDGQRTVRTVTPGDENALSPESNQTA